MKRKNLAIYIGIGCLLAVLAYLSYSNTWKQMLDMAERAFVEAIHQDLDERWKSLGESFSYHAGKEKEQYSRVDVNMDNRPPMTHELKDIDLSQNVDEDFLRRCFHSHLVTKNHIICPDSLNARWQNNLMESTLKVQTVAVVCSSGEGIGGMCDSLLNQVSYIQLPVRFAGVMNEIQLYGFVRFIGFDIFYFNPSLSIYICLFIGWIAWVIKKSIVDNRKSSLPKEGTFRLSKEVVYSPDLRCFMKGTEKITLPPKSNLIVKALLEAENHQLHGADLLAKVWGSNESNMNKLYIQNTKLRAVLKMLGDGFDVVSVERNHFRLVFPYLHGQS